MSFQNRVSSAALICIVSFAAPPPQKDTPPAAPIIQPGAPGQPGKTVSAAEAAAIVPRPPSQADIEFIQGMIMHHSQAIEMVDLLLTRTSNKDLLTLAKRMSISQIDEIEFMRQWLREHNQPAPPRGSSLSMSSMGMSKPGSSGRGDVPAMPGMLTPNQMRALARAFGPAFDQLFLNGMIQHHTGALDMVDNLFAAGAGQDGLIFDMATDIENTQSAEIEIMKKMLAPKPAPRKAVSKDKK
jgi:uncharacterized protein (DUF305 family)